MRTGYQIFTDNSRRNVLTLLIINILSLKTIYVTPIKQIPVKEMKIKHIIFPFHIAN